ncbi:MAG: MarR family transcriptional regulator [Tissierellia bacterium]|nr:MarR family transcriptional regulator [Tissierellia bacterium]
MSGRMSKDLQNRFISILEKAANGKVNILDFGKGMKFYRGEIHIIKRIGDYEGIHAAELANTIGVTRAVVNKTVNKLEKRKLVYKVTDQMDRKIKKIYLTEKGKLAYKYHEQYHKEHDADFINYLESLDDDKAKVIEEFLIKASNIVEKHF